MGEGEASGAEVKINKIGENQQNWAAKGGEGGGRGVLPLRTPTMGNPSTSAVAFCITNDKTLRES